MKMIKYYDTILSPVVTEKATNANEHDQIIFKVAMDATKPDIKTAVENLYSVKVKRVNTIVCKGKTKRFRGRLGKQNDYKKAIVTMVDGHSIDITTGL